MHKIFRKVTKFKRFQVDKCLNGVRFAHMAANFVLSQDIVNDSPFIQINKVRSSLQRCVTWIKKSPKGRKAWFDAYEIENMLKYLNPTPVKKPILSVFLMMEMMLKYKKAIDECFGSQTNLNLRQRVPANDTWEIFKIITNTFEQLILLCL